MSCCHGNSLSLSHRERVSLVEALTYIESYRNVSGPRGNRCVFIQRISVQRCRTAYAITRVHDSPLQKPRFHTSNIIPINQCKDKGPNLLKMPKRSAPVSSAVQPDLAKAEFYYWKKLLRKIL